MTGPAPTDVNASPLSAAFSAYLRQFIPLTTAMGPNGASRIYLDVAPTKSGYGPGAADVVFQELNEPRPRLLDGTPVPLVDAIWQIDVYAKTAQQRSNVAKAMRTALRLWRGEWSGHVIRDVSIEMDRGTSDSADDGSEERDWRHTFRVRVWHRNNEES